MSAPPILRLPPLTVAQAGLLLDVLDALTNAVVQTYGEAIFDHERRVPPPEGDSEERGD